MDTNELKITEVRNKGYSVISREDIDKDKIDPFFVARIVIGYIFYAKEDDCYIVLANNLWNGKTVVANTIKEIIEIAGVNKYV